MARTPLPRLRRICLALPEAHEKKAWGAPTFRVRNRMFATFAGAGNQHTDGRPSVWCKATFITQKIVIGRWPSRYFVPPYVGPSGWFGIYLDSDPDWQEVADRLRESYRLVATKRLIAKLEKGR